MHLELSLETSDQVALFVEARPHLAAQFILAREAEVKINVMHVSRSPLFDPAVRDRVQSSANLLRNRQG